MNSSKIILCVLGAAAAGAIVGSMLTSGKGGEWLGKIRNAAGDWSDKLKSQQPESSANEAQRRAEFDQANSSSPGIA
jgi:hypothetical protein